jgi:hypothetical protein
LVRQAVSMARVPRTITRCPRIRDHRAAMTVRRDLPLAWWAWRQKDDLLHVPPEVRAEAGICRHGCNGRTARV